MCAVCVLALDFHFEVASNVENPPSKFENMFSAPLRTLLNKINTNIVLVLVVPSDQFDWCSKTSARKCLVLNKKGEAGACTARTAHAEENPRILFGRRRVLGTRHEETNTNLLHIRVNTIGCRLDDSGNDSIRVDLSVRPARPAGDQEEIDIHSECVHCKHIVKLCLGSPKADPSVIVIWASVIVITTLCTQLYTRRFCGV